MGLWVGVWVEKRGTWGCLYICEESGYTKVSVFSFDIFYQPIIRKMKSPYAMPSSKSNREHNAMLYHHHQQSTQSH